MPTLLAAAGVERPDGLDGADLGPVVRGEETEPRLAYADGINLYDLNSGMTMLRPDDGLMHAVTDGVWKLIHRPLVPEKDELYHLAEDPAEAVNLFADEPDRVAAMRKLVDAFDGYVTESLGAATDPETMERLRALGYVGD